MIDTAESSPTLPESAWSASPEEVLQQLQVDPETGLDDAEVERRRARFGANRLREARRRSVWKIWFDQFRSLVVALLAAAAVAALAFGDWIEAVAILVVIVINALIGFFTELSAVRSMEALRKLGGVSAVVRRNGQSREINAEDLVPGDIVLLEAGDAVNADLRVIQSSQLQADESTLTGESVPVGKREATVPEDAPLADRESMLFKGTFVTRGSGTAIAVGTGMNTQLGQITELVEEAAGEERTPLERRLDRLAHQLIWVTLIVAALVSVLGILRDKDLLLMIETGVALAVAAIPEGLPIVATIALGRGMLRMARRNALIRRLAAVETLGATSVICTDKTGTLTENRMTVTRLLLESGPVSLRTGGRSDGPAPAEELTAGRESLRRALEVGVLCNNASFEQTDEGEARGVGDPMEVALLVAGSGQGIDRGELLQRFPEVREVAFDPEVKKMATVHRADGGFRVAVKGAPEAVLEISTRVAADDGPREMTDDEREQWLRRNTEMAEQGLRILAVAEKTVDDSGAEPYADLTFLGLVGLEDPPRAPVRGAIQACREAGIRVVMVTGDQASTARGIARQVDLVREEDAEVVLGRELKRVDELNDEQKRRIVNAFVLARVSPRQKLDLIDLHRQNGAIVAMTGDGVNDAPALQKADIGIAMGRRGTQVAREAAEMILQDDAFDTIVVAVEEGRAIFGNIRKFVRYLLSCNVGEILVVGLASAANLPLPVLPLQILFLNLVTDVFPALALGVGRAGPGIMKQPPRDPREPILPARYWWGITGYGTAFMAGTLGALWAATEWFGAEQEVRVRSISFLTLAVAQLWHVFNMRDRGSGPFRNDVSRNPFVWGAIVLCLGLLALAVYVPLLARVLRVEDPGPVGWALVLGLSLVPWLAGTIAHAVFRWRERPPRIDAGPDEPSQTEPGR